MHSLIHRFDLSVSNLFLSLPRSLVWPMAFVSFLGQPIITIGIIIVIATFSWYNNNIKLLLSAAVGFIAILLNTLLKFSFGRIRPNTDYVQNMIFDTFSFPSGHSCGSLVAYGLLGYILWHVLPQPYALIVSIFLGILIVLIGLSRIYLGAHYASDVLGGWLLGLIALFIIIFVIKPL